MLRHKLISMTAPSERAVTLCTMVTHMEGCPSNLIFPMGLFPLLLRLASHR